MKRFLYLALACAALSFLSCKEDEKNEEHEHHEAPEQGSALVSGHVYDTNQNGLENVHLHVVYDLPVLSLAPADSSETPVNQLLANFPNPFSDTTIVRIRLGEAAHIEINLHNHETDSDSLLYSEHHHQAGLKFIPFDFSELENGVHHLHIHIGEGQEFEQAIVKNTPHGEHLLAAEPACICAQNGSYIFYTGIADSVELWNEQANYLGRSFLRNLDVFAHLEGYEADPVRISLSDQQQLDLDITMHQP